MSHPPPPQLWREFPTFFLTFPEDQNIFLVNFQVFLAQNLTFVELVNFKTNFIDSRREDRILPHTTPNSNRSQWPIAREENTMEPESRLAPLWLLHLEPRTSECESKFSFLHFLNDDFLDKVIYFLADIDIKFVTNSIINHIRTLLKHFQNLLRIAALDC